MRGMPPHPPQHRVLHTHLEASAGMGFPWVTVLPGACTDLDARATKDTPSFTQQCWWGVHPTKASE